MLILVVEDEAKLAKALQEGLEGEGYSVDVASTGENGFYLLQKQGFDLVILDVMLPGHDGLEILSTMRRRGLKLPVLLLTARNTVEDRVRGLDAGADDYLAKPFAFEELLARMRVLLRRQPKPEAYKLEDLELDAARRVVTRGGNTIFLAPREFDVLEYLFANRGRVVSREMLAHDVWQLRGQHIYLDNAIDVQIAHLRRKIDGNFERKLLHTVRGVGYLLRGPEVEQSE